MKKINFIHIAKNGGSSIKEYCNNNNKLLYNGHDAKISNLDNQMIIIRDPYSRFCSAVKYAIDNYSNSEKIKKIIDANLIEPEQWLNAWENENHEYHHLIINEITNEEHTIDSKKISLKWTYSPQYYWINEKKLKYIIPFDNMNKHFLELFGDKIPVKNASSNIKEYNLSNKSKEFLKKIYKKDFEFIEKYPTFTTFI